MEIVSKEAALLGCVFITAGFAVVSFRRHLAAAAIGLNLTLIGAILVMNGSASGDVLSLQSVVLIGGSAFAQVLLGALVRWRNERHSTGVASLREPASDFSHDG